MTAQLRIAPDLALPLDFVTSTQAILAKKGSGKSYTASVQAEELLGAGQQVVVIDPTGAWFGLRSSADGKASGFPIAILGGEHGDVPLEVGAGEVIAEAIAADHFSAVLDLTLFRKGESLRFMAAFLETLYRKNRDALHVFIDEADTVAPQRPMGEDARTLGATEDVVRRGRRRGLGCTLITQRPQVLNKNVLSQVDMVTALRMNHPKDLAAIREWVDVQADVDQAKAMIASLPSLPIGDAWFWAPAAGIFQRSRVRRRTTFDSGATPKAGERAAAPKVLAAVDLQQLGATIAATAERAKESDPKALRAEVLKLRRELEAALEAPAPVAYLDSDLVALRSALRDLGAGMEVVGMTISAILGRLPGVSAAAPSPSAQLARRLPERAAPPPAPRVRSASGPGDPALGGGQRKILTALAQYPGGRSKVQVAILTGYTHDGGGFGNYIGALRSAGLIEGGSDRLVITDDGLRALGDFQPLPTGRALLDHWMRELGKAERLILQVLADEYPKTLPKDYIALKAGYEANGGGFGNALGRLRSLELIEGKAKMKASDALFEVP